MNLCVAWRRLKVLSNNSCRLIYLDIIFCICLSNLLFIAVTQSEDKTVDEKNSVEYHIVCINCEPDLER